MTPDTILLTGDDLAPEDVLAVARRHAPVAVAPPALLRVARCRQVVERLLRDESKPVVYGLTTGFGSLRDVLIRPDQVKQLQRNLIRSHSTGVGEPAGEDVVRAMMLLRANTLAKGYSGVRPVVVETLVQLLNRRVYPVVPVQGSAGASGDLQPLSHMALVLLGEGEAFLPDGRRVPGREALDAAGVLPLELEAKEGLALNNGTQFMTAVGVLALLDAEHLARAGALACALSLEALKGVPMAFEERIQRVRPHPGQQLVARAIAGQLAGSDILALPVNTARLRNAQKYLAEAARSLVESADHCRSEEGKDRCLAAGDSARLVLDSLERKAADYPRELSALLARRRGPVAAADPAEEARRAAKELFDPERSAVEGIHQQFSSERWSHQVVEARKLLKSAWDELERLVADFVPVQDDYSFRCAPQVIGAALDALGHARRVLTVEMNAATDNPLIFPPEPHGEGVEDVEAYARSLTLADCRSAVVSGGNFHGEPVALALDAACVGLAEVGNLSERRTFHLTSRHLSNGLPPFLVREIGLQSGLMLTQYTAAALVSENKGLCFPATADSIPTCEDAEDHVSMGAWAARKFARVAANVSRILAVEFLCAAQGVELREPALPSPHGRLLLHEIRKVCKKVEEDRELGRDLEALAASLRDAGLGERVEALWALHQQS